MTLPACFGERLSLAEVREAIDGVVLLGQTRQAVDDVVEISTSFTIGQGVEAALEEVRAFLESQAPCTELTISPGEIRVDFGDLSDSCTYRGRTYGGLVVYSFTLADDAVHVRHDYQGFTNGQVTVDGEAEVEWGGEARRVVSDFVISGSNLSITAQGDRSFSWLDPSVGLGGGILIEGEQSWEGGLGPWEMSIDGVEVRAQDPVPQGGSYELVTPRDVLASLAFSRVDEDTIQMVFSGPQQTRTYHVNSIGVVDEVESD